MALVFFFFGLANDLNLLIFTAISQEHPHGATAHGSDVIAPNLYTFHLFNLMTTKHSVC